jgi:uncharacterized membrane protein YukC
MTYLKLDKASEIKDLASGDLPSLYVNLNSSSNGLASEQWQQNYQKYGKNILTMEKREWAIIRFLRLFFSPLSILLITLSLASYFSGTNCSNGIFVCYADFYPRI